MDNDVINVSPLPAIQIHTDKSLNRQQVALHLRNEPFCFSVLSHKENDQNV